MGKIICLALIFVITSCASEKGLEGTNLDYRMKQSLFMTQSHFEDLFILDSGIFSSFEKRSCILDWSKEVLRLSAVLRKSTMEKERAIAWFQLANCYNYVNDFEKAIYYYDLSLGSSLLKRSMRSKISLNIGQMYELRGQRSIAYSYYLDSLSENKKNWLAIFLLAQAEYSQGEYSTSNKYISRLRLKYPKSNFLRFFEGVNYFHQKMNRSLKNKVLLEMDEKFVGRVLLRMSVDLYDNTKKETLRNDLKRLEVNEGVYRKFKKYLLTELGK